MRTQLLAALKEADDYISGQELCEHFGVSRTAIWKAVKQLKEAGYVIEAVQNKGYKIVSTPDCLNTAELESIRKTKWAGREIFYFDTIDSTNTKAKQLAEEGHPTGTLVVAEKQEAGRGRRGRGFESPAGVGIFMTLVLKPDFAPDRASMLTLIAALAVSKAISEKTGQEAEIKWPNDIYWKDKKICGMLIENDLMGRNISQSIAGVGININQEVFHSSAPNPVSLFQITGKQYDIFNILEHIMLRIQIYYDLLQKNNTALITAQYERSLFRKEGMYRYKDVNGEFMANIVCVEPEGRLILEDETQTKRGYMFKEVEYLLK